MKTNGNDPAFDGSRRDIIRSENNAFSTEIINNPLTKLEYFSIMALQGLLSNSYNDGVTQPLSTATHIEIAKMAVSQAEVLIKALNKENEK